MRPPKAKYVITLFILFLSLSASASIPKEIVESHVHSLEEFVERFNGNEIYPLVLENDTNKIRTTRLSLFNRDLLTNESTRDSMLNVCIEFLDSIETAETGLSMSSPKCWIDAYCDFIYNGKELKLILQMTLEEFQPDYWRWAISDIIDYENNLQTNDSKVLPINPLEHEFDFMHLDDFFSEYHNNIVRTKSDHKPIDTMSYFFGIVSTGGVKFDKCNRVVFHCEQIPGWVFTAEQIHRIEESNSGWLINSLNKVQSNQ